MFGSILGILIGAISGSIIFIAIILVAEKNLKILENSWTSSAKLYIRKLIYTCKEKKS